MSKKTSRVKKEELFVGVAASDSTTIDYNDVSRYIGMKMPFKSPKSTCGIRITENVVAFSLLMLTKASASKIADKPLDLPRGPLIKLEKRASSIQSLDIGKMVVEFNDQVLDFSYTVDKNGVLSLDGKTENFDLPKSAIQMAIYFKSPVVERVIAFGFIGHLGKPGDPDNALRIASKILRSATLLGHFKALTGFESVEVPPAPRLSGGKQVRKQSDKAELNIPVALFSADNPPKLLASGTLNIEINLDIPGSGNSRLLYNLTPSKEIFEIFETYRFIVNETLSKILMTYLGDSEIRSIAADIALGEVGPGTVMRLRDALLTISSGVNFTPTMFNKM